MSLRLKRERRRCAFRSSSQGFCRRRAVYSCQHRRFSPAALRAGEWLEPPVRLISGRQLALLFGQRHPATDEEIARRARRQRSPFTRQRIQALALSPAKQKRYLLCALLLTVFYLMFGSYSALISGIASFVLGDALRQKESQGVQVVVSPYIRRISFVNPPFSSCVISIGRK